MMSQFSDATDAMALEAVLDDVSSIGTMDSSPSYEQPSGNNLISRCILTAFPPDLDPKWLQPRTFFEEHKIAIWCGQFEICPQTDRLHVHFYIEFKHAHRMRFNSLKSVIEKATGKPGDIQLPRRISKKQRQCAINYVLKPDGIADDTTPFIWADNKFPVAYDPSLRKKSAKSKQDLDKERIDYILSKPRHWTWDQLVHEDSTSQHLLATCSWGQKFHNGRYATTTQRLIKEVIVFYGAGGTGKTTMAQNFDTKDDEISEERYFKRNYADGNFWGGGRTQYRGQRIVHLEEFCGQETAATFKELCDIGKPGPSVNVKNGGTKLNHDTVIITCNHHPAAWYKKLCTSDNKQWPPIARRITQVFFFPEYRPDGSHNVPDEENPPWYEDQTETFRDRNFIMNFDTACQHAQDCWPLPQEATSFYDPNYT